MEESHTLPQPRNTFITVLCILTFIGSGWGIVSGLFNIYTASKMGDSIEEVSEGMEDAIDDIQDNDGLSDSQKDFFESIFTGISESVTPENVRNAALVSILSCLLTIAGALLMWNLNKKGFYLYVAGIVLIIAGTLFVFGGSLMGVFYALSAGFWGVVFIILYGVNLKHMN